MNRFPWARFMALGLGVLRMPPREFWAATPREIASAFARQGSPEMPRAVLDTLMQRFPDEG